MVGMKGSDNLEGAGKDTDLAIAATKEDVVGPGTDGAEFRTLAWLASGALVDEFWVADIEQRGGFAVCRLHFRNIKKIERFPLEATISALVLDAATQMDLTDVKAILQTPSSYSSSEA